MLKCPRLAARMRSGVIREDVLHIILDPPPVGNLQITKRILAVWTDQNRRFPGHPYIEKQMLDAGRALAVQKNLF